MHRVPFDHRALLLLVLTLSVGHCKDPVGSVRWVSIVRQRDDLRERDVLRRGQAIQESLTEQGLTCEFDQFAGPAPVQAVLRIAAWRRCQVVVLKRRQRRWRWPWRGVDLAEQLPAQPSPLTFLVLPTEGLSLPPA